MHATGSESTIFLEGPAGSGKTTYALDYLHRLIAAGVPAESILVLTPQRALGQPYLLARQPDAPRVAGEVTMATLSGLARRNLDRFWPLVAEAAGFDVAQEPVFLTIETAQYYMMRFARPAIREGMFDALSLSPARIAAQLLDNMAKTKKANQQTTVFNFSLNKNLNLIMEILTRDNLEIYIERLSLKKETRQRI